MKQYLAFVILYRMNVLMNVCICVYMSSKVELLLLLVHLRSVFPLGFLFYTSLQSLQFECELRPQFLQSHLLLIPKHITMSSKEDVVSLVMQCYHLSPFKLRVLWENRLEQPTHGLPQSCLEVV